MSYARVLAFVGAALVSGVCAHPFAVDLRERLVAGDGALQAGPAPLAAMRAALPNAAPPLRVLFVGNSLTTYNGMTAMIAQLAAAAGEPRALEPVLVTHGGYGVLEHVQQGRVQERLARERFDYVVLQDQGQRPGVPAWRQEQVFAPMRTLHAAITGAGARPLLYATFARRDGDLDVFRSDDYDSMQTRIDEGYEAIGQELGIPRVPIGRIWRGLRRAHPELSLWREDGVHPTRAGSYLVACAMLRQLYGRSPIGNPYLAGLPADQAHVLQQSVAAEMVSVR